VAAWNSNLIIAGGGQATPSVEPATTRPVYGSVTFPAGSQIAAADTVPLFYLSAGSLMHIMGFWFDSGALDSGATLSMALQDSTTPTPNTIVPTNTIFRAGGFISHLNASHGMIGWAIGYQAPNLLLLKPSAGAGAALAAQQVLYFGFELARD
jgi:hypothetical protein